MFAYPSVLIGLMVACFLAVYSPALARAEDPDPPSPAATQTKTSDAERRSGPSETAEAEKPQAKQTTESADPETTSAEPTKSEEPSSSTSSDEASSKESEKPTEASTTDSKDSATADPTESTTPTTSPTTQASTREKVAPAAVVGGVIDPGSIKITNTSNPDPNHPTVLWEQLRVDFRIDTTGQNVRSGDTFSLNFPSQLTGPNTTFNIMNEAGTAVVAKCTVSGAAGGKVVCEFQDYVNTHPNLKGSAWVSAQASKVTENTTVNFGTATGSVPVDLPGPGGIVPPGEPEPPTKIQKYGWFQSSVDPNRIVWYVDVPPGGYTPGQDINLVDTIDPDSTGHHLITDPAPRLLIAASADAVRNDDWSESPALTFDVVNGGKGFEATIPGSIVEAGHYYRLEYHTYVDDPAAMKAGDKFSNTVNVNGIEVSSHVTSTVNGSGTLDGPGFGGFSVSKTVEGPAAGEVPGTTEFTVRATWTEGGEEKSELLTLTPDEPAALHNIPSGTEVTLSEIGLPTLDGVEWGTPRFTAVEGDVTVSDDGQTATVTVGDQTTAMISLTNIANPVETPTPSPTPTTETPSPSTETTTSRPQPPATSPGVVLPQTGSDAELPVAALGILLTALGGWAVARRRR